MASKTRRGKVRGPDASARLPAETLRIGATVSAGGSSATRDEQDDETFSPIRFTGRRSMASKAVIKEGEQLPEKRKKLDVITSVQNAATGASIVVAAGLEVVHDGRLKRVVAVTQESSILEDKITGALLTASHGDYDLPEPPSSEARLLIETSPAAKARAQHIHSALAPYARLGRSLTPHELETACAAVGLKEGATRRYIRRLKVQDTWRSCLNTKPGSKIGGRRIKGERLLIFDTVVTRELKRKEGITEEHIVKAVNDALTQAKKRTMSHTTIRKYIRGTGTDLRLRRRLSGKVELEAITPVGEGETASRPLEKVQIDSTRADVIVVDEEGEPLARPWITLVIDVFSRMVLGMYISLDAPSAISVGAAVVDAMTPKKDRMRHLGIHDLPWPCHGKFESICGLDHGPEHKNTAIAHGLDMLGLPPPIWRSDITHGAIIERLIGSFMGMMHMLPGTTFSNPKQRGDYDSAKEAKLSIEEFERWTVIAVADYHASPHKGLDFITPLQKWEQGWKELGRVPAFIQNMREVRLSFLPYQMRTVTKEGIEINCERYSSHELASLIRRHARVQVHYDPRDLSRIWVRSPLNSHLIEVRWRRMNVRPYSLAYRRLRRMANRRAGCNPEMRGISLIARQHNESVIANATVNNNQRRRDSKAREDNRRRQAATELGSARTTGPSPSSSSGSTGTIDWSSPPKTFRVWRR